MLVQKATGPANTMIVSLDNLPKSRGVRGWYKLMREAKGTHTTQVHEVTERLHSVNRNQVPAKDVVPTIEAYVKRNPKVPGGYREIRRRILHGVDPQEAPSR